MVEWRNGTASRFTVSGEGANRRGSTHTTPRSWAGSPGQIEDCGRTLASAPPYLVATTLRWVPPYRNSNLKREPPPETSPYPTNVFISTIPKTDLAAPCLGQGDATVGTCTTSDFYCMTYGTGIEVRSFLIRRSWLRAPPGSWGQKALSDTRTQQDDATPMRRCQ